MVRAKLGVKAAVVLTALGLVLAACSNASSSSSSSQSPSSSSAQGITKTSVNVGALATLSGPLAADFGAIVPGVQAYFSYINAHGGVYGRKINLSNVIDDGGVASNNATGARTLVEQDKVFGIVGMASFFFTAEPYLAQTGTPTFGYATENNWAGPKNLFGAYGSIVDNDTAGPAFAYVAHQVHAKSVGVIAYGVPQSAGVCQVGVNELQKEGFHIGYSDLSAPLFGDMTPDALRMKQAGVDFLVTCMDVNGNVEIARAMNQNGMSNFSQLWLDGYNTSTLDQYASIMKNTYFMVQHVPFEAAKQFPGVFPGLQTYLKEMAKYSPQNIQSEVAMEGWISAATFVQGLKNAGPNPTQSSVVNAINKLTAFTAGGVTTPVNWTVGHTVVLEPSCESYVETGTGANGAPAFHIVFNHGHNPWVCLNYKGSLNLNHPVSAPTGSPGT